MDGEVKGWEGSRETVVPRWYRSEDGMVGRYPSKERWKLTDESSTPSLLLFLTSPRAQSSTNREL